MHTVQTARDRRWDGWDTLTNGDLIRAAEADGFDVMVTGDKKIIYQQNNRLRIIALVVVSITKWRIVRRNGPAINAALLRASSGSFEYVELESELRSEESAGR